MRRDSLFCFIYIGIASGKDTKGTRIVPYGECVDGISRVTVNGGQSTNENYLWDLPEVDKGLQHIANGNK